MKNKYIISVFAAVTLMGCQSTQARYDINEEIDFTQISSCQLLETQPQDQDNPVILDLVHRSVGQHAMQRGITLTTAESACVLSYNLSYKDKPDNSSVNFSIGGGRTTGNSSIGIGIGKTIDLPGNDGTLTTININLTFDEVPAWYGASTFENELDMATSKRKSRIDNAVSAIFNHYPGMVAKEIKTEN